ncbi:MAG: hypothetical protein LBI37_00740 [Puniceicoccales bacterium]|jgi:hypothetical protein|nr:hypothetical protein [Puniceicoccales bacterium]
MFIDKIKKVLVVAACGMLMGGNCFGGQVIKVKLKSVKKKQQIEKYDKEYTICRSAGEMNGFMINVFCGELEVPLEDAVETIIKNTAEEVCNLSPDNKGYKDLLPEHKPLIAVLAWAGLQYCASASPAACKVCLSILDDIAATDYDKAKLILRSQCTDDNYTPKQGAEWTIIGNTICMLKREALKDAKNSHAIEAANFLVQLKNMLNKPYEALLGDRKY